MAASKCFEYFVCKNFIKDGPGFSVLLLSWPPLKNCLVIILLYNLIPYKPDILPKYIVIHCSIQCKPN